MFERRLSWAYYLLCAALAVVCIKLFYLQGMQISLEEPESVLYPPAQWRKIPAHRGAICDRHGVILVGDRPYLDLAVKYEVLKESDDWLESVQAVTGREGSELLADQQRIIQRVNRIRSAILRANGRVPKRIYEEAIPHTLVAGISLEVAARIETNPEQYPGLIVEQNFRRDRPYENMATQVFGILGKAPRPERGESYDDPNISPGDLVGVNGIEKQYDRFLRGVPGLFQWEKDRTRSRRVNSDPLLGGVSAAVRKKIDERHAPDRRTVLFEAEAGRTIILALDRAAQKAAEDALGAERGAVVVMDVHTGEVLVLASTPLARELSAATQDCVSPGSVMKPFVALAAAGAPEVGIDMHFSCSGSIRIGGVTRSCSHAHGRMDMKEAIAQSCNVYFWRLALQIGPQQILAMANDLGLVEPTGIDLPHEWKGRFLAGENVMNLAIGQGNVQTTPLQVAVAMAAVANGGKVLRPRLALKIIPEPDPWDHADLGTQIVRELAFSPEALRIVREGMRGTIEHGTASRVPGLRELKVAAKTGTAEIGDSGLNHAWLVGFVPYDSPRYAFAAVVHRTNGHGADTAGPIVVEVLNTLNASVEQKTVGPGS